MEIILKYLLTLLDGKLVMIESVSIPSNRCFSMHKFVKDQTI
jgi:hypothetical protein